MEVLVSFSSAMYINDNGFVLFPEILKIDEDFSNEVNEIGERSKFVLYNLYLTDCEDITVEFINKSFRGSFVFIKSEKLNRWFLMTPFSKLSWDKEHVIVIDDRMKEMLMRQNPEGDEDQVNIITCVPSNEIN